MRARRARWSLERAAVGARARLSMEHVHVRVQRVGGKFAHFEVGASARVLVELTHVRVRRYRRTLGRLKMASSARMPLGRLDDSESHGRGQL